MALQTPDARLVRTADIRPLSEADLPIADRVMRIAFGTFLGMPDPTQFMGDAAYVHPRWRSNPAAAFGAFLNGEVVGSNFATCWGSVGFFGPLTVRPDLWDSGIGRRLMEPVLRLFDAWPLTHAGLFTFAHSPKHVGFYQSLGFWPRYLTAVMSRSTWVPARPAEYLRFSDLSGTDREKHVSGCRQVTHQLYPGLDLTAEIDAVDAHALGDTVVLVEGGAPSGFAVCHTGAGTEGGSGVCFVKFGAVAPGSDAPARFERLLDACADFATSRGATRIVAGVNTSRHQAYRILLARNFRAELQGVTMHRPNEPGYSRPDAFVMDDWR